MGKLILVPAVLRDGVGSTAHKKRMDWEQKDAGDEARWRAVRQEAARRAPDADRARLRRVFTRGGIIHLR